MVARIISGPRLLMTALLSTFSFLRIMKQWNDLSPLIFTEHYPSLDSFKYHINYPNHKPHAQFIKDYFQLFIYFVIADPSQ